MKQNSTLLIDGHYFLFRSFGVPFKFHSKENQVPLHVVTTYLKFLRQSVEIVSKTHEVKNLVVLFDSQSENPNKQIDPNYKANRDYTYEDDSPFDHYPYIREALNSLRIANYESEVYEADDLIATLANEEAPKQQVFVVSNDSDFYQLIDNDTSQVLTKPKGESVIFREDSLRDQLSIKPTQYVEWKCMVGDSADNIKGVPGIGPVRATRIINGEMEFDLSDYSDLLEKNNQLITLKRDVEHSIANKDRSFDEDALSLDNKEIFQMCGFV